MNVLDLSPAHVGQTVTVRHIPHGTGPDWTITGTLTGISVTRDEIQELTLSEVEPTTVYGRPVVHLSVGPFTAEIHDPSRTVVYFGGGRL